VKAARITAYGPVENLRVEEVDDPVAGPGLVVVDIAAAAVNYPDLLIMSGGYQVRWPLPLIPGSEFAGTVRAVGPGVTGVAAGDRVAGSTAVGAFAEQIAVPAAGLWVVPAEADLAEAAAFRVTYLTAYHALRSVAGVSPGAQVVVLGAAGGVGLAAVEVARVLGARVIAAVSSQAKAAVCRARGAHETIDYSSENLKDRIKQLTGGGADVVIDPVGGPYSEPALRALAPGGRFVCLGFASSEIPSIPLNLVLLKDVVVCGMEIRTFSERRPADARRDAEEVTEHFRAGRLRPYIGGRYSLEQAADALRAVRDRQAIGKLVVVMLGHDNGRSSPYLSSGFSPASTAGPAPRTAVAGMRGCGCSRARSPAGASGKRDPNRKAAHDERSDVPRLAASQARAPSADRGHAGAGSGVGPAHGHHRHAPPGWPPGHAGASRRGARPLHEP
jgi:NADPH2:quinone reductase